mmetsp:Transcript_1929/g.7382  ORF Transcript_1929/g.7382 Transcript_1929/m.7382 type:complete len:340 (-) Transcript_1929:587-1606(-)
MEMAATFLASPTPNSAFCITTDTASKATVTPVNRNGSVAFEMASWLVKKNPSSVCGINTATKPTPNIIAAVSLETSHGHCAASSTSPLPKARPESAPAARPMPMQGNTRVNIRLIKTFTAAVSAVPSLPTIQYMHVMPVAKSRFVILVGAAWLNRVFKSSPLGFALANPISFALVNPIFRYITMPTYTETVVPTPAPSTPNFGITICPTNGTSTTQPKINNKLNVTFTKCITSNVFMYICGCCTAFQNPRNAKFTPTAGTAMSRAFRYGTANAITAASEVSLGTIDGASTYAPTAIGTPNMTHATSAAFRGTAAISGLPSPIRLALMACTPLLMPCKAA